MDYGAKHLKFGGKFMFASYRKSERIYRCEIIWQHIGTILHSAGMDYQDVISIRTYLSDPSFDEANVRLRMKYMGENRPASTVICCQLLETKWKLEVEIMAAK